VITVSAGDWHADGALALGIGPLKKRGVKNPPFFPKTIGNFQRFSADLNMPVERGGVRTVNWKNWGNSRELSGRHWRSGNNIKAMRIE